MYSVRSRVDTGFATSLSRRVGATFLGLSGLCNLFVASWLYGVVGSESALLSLLAVLEGRWSESQLLARGETLSVLVGTVIPALVVIALLVGLLQCCVAVLAATGRAYSLSIGASVVGMVTVVTIPLCAVAMILCWASKDQFRGDPTLARVTAQDSSS